MHSAINVVPLRGDTANYMDPFHLDHPKRRQSAAELSSRLPSSRDTGGSAPYPTNSTVFALDHLHLGIGLVFPRAQPARSIATNLSRAIEFLAKRAVLKSVVSRAIVTFVKRKSSEATWTSIQLLCSQRQPSRGQMRSSIRRSDHDGPS